MRVPPITAEDPAHEFVCAHSNTLVNRLRRFRLNTLPRELSEEDALSALVEAALEETLDSESKCILAGLVRVLECATLCFVTERIFLARRLGLPYQWTLACTLIILLPSRCTFADRYSIIALLGKL